MNELLDYYIYGLCASDGTMSITKRNSKISYCESIEMSEEQILKDIANDMDIDIRSRNRIINEKERIFYRISIPIKHFRGIEEYFRPNRIGLFIFLIIYQIKKFITLFEDCLMETEVLQNIQN